MGWSRFLWLAIGVLVLDRLTKLYVLEGLDLVAVGRIDVLPPYLVFVMAWNTGVNFGLFGSADLRWALVGIAVVVSVALSWWAMRRPSLWVRAGAAVVAGGALGNAWDRIQYGAVADFLNMSCCGIQNPFAFNVADIAIVLGALVIAIKA
ncbi:MAG: signal peptidase II [Pseudomonadota bacterium]